MDMIYPYKWKIETHWHTSHIAWIVCGSFIVGGKTWVITMLQENKEDLSELHDGLRAFWRKRGAM